MKEKKNDILRFLASKYYVLAVAAIIGLTISSHYSGVPLVIWLCTAALLQLPFEYLEKKGYDPVWRGWVKKERITGLMLVLITILGLSAEYVWPNNVWVLVLRLFGIACVVAWSLIIKDKV